MRALRFDSTLVFAPKEPAPIPETGEALINVRMAGICHTDLEITRGYKGFKGILGHEFVGEVAEDVGPFRRGDRVVGEINIACGTCSLCRKGIPSQCVNGRRTLGIYEYPGVFADQMRLPVRNLYRVPDSVPDKDAVFTEPLAAAFQVTAIASVRPDQRVVVIGAGKLGLLVAQVLKLTGCDLTVIARQPRPIELLTQWRIPFLDTRREDWFLPELRRSFDVVVEATGSADGFALGLDFVRPRGTLVLKSTYEGLPNADLTRIVVDEIALVGSRCGPFPAALRAMEQGLIDLHSMIDQVYPLDDAVAAFEHALGRGVLKILLKP